METQLAIFIGAVGALLLANAVGFWLVSRALSKLLSKIDDGLELLEPGSETREFLVQAERVSGQIAEAGRQTNEQVAKMAPLLEHAQDVYGYGLALVDVRFERACDVAVKYVGKATQAIARPAFRIASFKLLPRLGFRSPEADAADDSVSTGR